MATPRINLKQISNYGAHFKFSRHIFPSPLQSPLRAAERGEMVRKFKMRPEPPIECLIERDCQNGKAKAVLFFG